VPIDAADGGNEVFDGARTSTGCAVGVGVRADGVCHRIEFGFGDVVQSPVTPVLFEMLEVGAVGASRTGFQRCADYRDDFAECGYGGDGADEVGR
jgi:hypothetical protein